MGLKEDYYREMPKIQQELLRKQRQQQMEEEKKQREMQREAFCRSLCEVVPSFREYYKNRSYYGVYNTTLAMALTPELQSVAREFIGICPAGAWQTLTGREGWQKCRLADGSVHIFSGFVPGDERFQYGSQKYVNLPYNFVEDTWDAAGSAWDHNNLYLFYDGFVHTVGGGAFLADGGPLTSAGAFSEFLLNHLKSYAKYGQFDKGGRYI